MGTLSSTYPDSRAVEAALDRANKAAYDISTLSDDIEDLSAQITINETNINHLKKLDVFVTPEMYGAVGDGETDDSAAFIAAVNSGHNVICKDNGNYLITGNVVCDAQSIIFDGNGATITVDITSDSRVTAFNFRHTAMVKNLNLFTNVASNVGGLAFPDTTTTNTFTINCHVKGFGLYGIVNCSNVINTTLEECCQLSGSNTGNGYYFSSRNNIIISNCIFLCAGGGDSLDHAVYIGGSSYDNIKVINNTFKLTDENCGIGPLINIAGPSAEKMTNCVIFGNYCDYSLTKAVSQAAVALAIEDSVFSNNIILGGSNTGGASLFLWKCENVKINANRFANNIITISKANNVTFSENDINTTIRIYGSKSNDIKDLNIINNNIIGNISCGDQYFNDFYIINNKINGHIYMNTGIENDKLVIRDNYIYSGYDTFAICIGKFSNVLVERNTVFAENDGEEDTRGIVFMWDYQDWYSGKNNICKDNYVQGVSSLSYYLVNIVNINNIDKDNNVYSN